MADKKRGLVFGQQFDSFQEAFPEIDKISIRVQESGVGVRQQSNTIHYTENNITGNRIRCSNDACRNGGEDIISVIENMVRNKLTDIEDNIHCLGTEVVGKNQRRRCLNYFAIKVNITFKQDN